MSVELERACLKGGLESSDELTAEDTAEHLDGKEEGAARGDPAGVIRSETAGTEGSRGSSLRFGPLQA